MFTMDVPYVPAQETSIVLAQADMPAGSTPQPDYLLKVCQDTASSVYTAGSAIRGVYPAGILRTYYGNNLDQIIDVTKTKTTLLEGTKHGTLIENISDNGAMYFMYEPTPDYEGNDQAVFMAVYEGIRYRIVVNLKVQIFPDPELCPVNRYELIKVNKPSSGSSGYGSGYTLGSLTFNISDLPGAAVGQTTGANITLDTNASGYDWFIDATPWDNSEFLPTSNPNEWVAKAGSAAAGKMDILSARPLLGSLKVA